MADHVRFFELCTLLRELASAEVSDHSTHAVDGIITLLTRTLLSAIAHEDAIAANLQKMQTTGQHCIEV